MKTVAHAEKEARKVAKGDRPHMWVRATVFIAL